MIITACFHFALYKVIWYKSITDQTFPHGLWLHHSFSSPDGAEALISISAIRSHQHAHESQEDGRLQHGRGKSGERISVCSSLIRARRKKRKVMEDARIHPLLPIHKHDLWMILHWESLGGLWLPVCNTSKCVGFDSVNMHCSRVCACVRARVCVCTSMCVCLTECFSGFESSQRHESLLTVFALHAQGVFVCSQGLSFSSSFLLLNQARSEQL